MSALPEEKKEASAPAAGENGNYFDASADEGKETVTAASGAQDGLSQPEQLLKDSSDEEDGGLKCPSHTTDLKLMSKIDAHVVPFLCVMYLLAFLGMVLLLQIARPVN